MIQLLFYSKPRYLNTINAQENDLKSNLIIMIMDFKEEMKEIKEIQENTITWLEVFEDVFKEYTNKPFYNIQRNTIKQVKQINKLYKA